MQSTSQSAVQGTYPNSASIDATAGNPHTLTNLISSLMFKPNVMNEDFYFADPLAIREQILEIERLLMSAKDAQTQIETTHTFSNGLYAREVFIPKGTIVVGKIHKKECYSIMSRGSKLTLTEDCVKLIRAPFAEVSKPGIKRIGLALENTLWTTIHATDERDLEKLEAELTVTSYDDIQTAPINITRFKTLEGALWRS